MTVSYPARHLDEQPRTAGAAPLAVNRSLSSTRHILCADEPVLGAVKLLVGVWRAADLTAFAGLWRLIGWWQGRERGRCLR
jgi:hypothetical protein